MTADHVVLLGDSIFDNESYTSGEPDVVAHLRDVLPDGWRATLLATDGATTADIARQAARLPDDATRLVLSIGGNDALGNADLLSLPASSTAEALALFEARSAAFETAYRRALTPLLSTKRPITTCTVYNGNLPALEGQLSRVALMLFNDVIVRVAIQHRLDLIDLRLVCTEPRDYANPIEPSGSGGRKIAKAIARAVGAATGAPPTRAFGPAG